MNLKDSDFLKKLLSTFKVEAEEHVSAMSVGLLELEKAATTEEQNKIIETVFREAHSLKGAARVVNVREVEKICQSLESIFAAFKQEDLVLSRELLDTLHRSIDTLGNLVFFLEAKRSVLDKKQIAEVIRQLREVLDAQADASSIALDRNSEPGELLKELKEVSIGLPALGETATVQTLQNPEEKAEPAKTVRISTTKLDTLLFQSEELLSSKLMARQHVADLGAVLTALGAWKKEWAKLHTDVSMTQQSMGGKLGQNDHVPAVDRVSRILKLLERNTIFLKSLESELGTLLKSVERDQRSLGTMVDQLLEDTKKVLMLPSSTLLEIFPKLVRELARDRGKEVELIIEGGEIEIDKRILEQIKDPLIHLVRNSVDHGVEKPEERVRRQKLARGTVRLCARQESGSEFELNISDDGAGINLAKVTSAAVKSGALPQEEVDGLSEPEALRLIFRSGISTSPIITDISGRGLGLAIVQEKVEKLGGTISVESQPGAETTFRIRLPVTLATFRGILVRVGERLFILPTTNVKRVLKVDKEKIRTVGNRETIQFEGQVIALVRMVDVLGLPSTREVAGSAGSAHLLVIGAAGKRIAFLVDEILDEREVLVKNLGSLFSRLRNIAGATVLGTGKVVPILNVSDLMESAGEATTSSAIGATIAKTESAKRSILIAEDSITARTLLKNILESAGYDVKTALDGADALTELKAGDFDLVVSDIEMPRMNGFDLTAKIREDQKLADLPVVLVTSLDSREDRERGIDVGANAYIVKSSFDQSNLLETIRRMI